MPLYALTIFTGAFLLFLVQPLVGKFILPWFGGSPGVWTTCLLFFQTLLLGGYAYAHFTSTRLKPRTQATLHLVLLGVALLWLPIAPDASWKPAPGDEPTVRILLLLTATLGLPYLLLSATGPLLQRWFHLSHPGASPYRLYALSNVGSLLALLAYPFVIEPLFSRLAQAWGWSVALVVFAIFCGLCAWQVRRLPGAGATPAMATAHPDANDAPAPAALDKLYWLIWPAIASVLLVATTNKLCVDVAVIPFLWVAPLALYLLTFILCFDHPRWYSRKIFAALFVVGCTVSGHLLSADAHAPLPLQLVGFTATLFVGGMICHGELYRLRPAPQCLTSYYLFIAAGGALGGLFVAVVAPQIFDDYYELHLGLWALAYLVAWFCWLHRSRSLAVGVGAGTILAVLILPALLADPAESGVLPWLRSYGPAYAKFYGTHWKWPLAALVAAAVFLRRGRGDQRSAWHWRQALLPSALTIMLAVVFLQQTTGGRENIVATSRNFYGTLTVRSYGDRGTVSHYNLLSHGITTHGLQLSHPPYDQWPTSYYGTASGIGLALDQFGAVHGGRHLAMVGLGTGTLAAYGEPGDRLRVYEINPAVLEIAHANFSYLAHTGAGVKLVLGDARLSLEEEWRNGGSQQFDVLALDAFSSDAIPVHLLTKEAFELYLHHLKPSGVIAVHISNRHVDLRPVVEALARQFELHLATVTHHPGEDDWWLYRTTWMLLSRDETRIRNPAIQAAADESSDETAKVLLWTDDWASLFGVLR